MSAGAKCKNCGAVLTGPYCGACGQQADVGIPSLGKWLLRAFADLYDFDSRLWRSLVLLSFKPGRLTCEYLDGRRARYSPPFRMYLVLSLVFFFLVAALRQTEAPVVDRPVPTPATEAPEAPAAAPAEAPARPRRGFNIETTDSTESGWSCDLSGTSGWDPAVRARLEASCERIAADRGRSFGRALVENIPLMMFLFIPIVALIMKLLYAFSRRKYVEHLFFLVHFHAFFFLLATVGLLLMRLADLVPTLQRPVVAVSAIGWIYLPVYLFLAMRRVYGQGRLVTGVKYVLLGGAYFVSLICTFIAVIVYTALTL